MPAQAITSTRPKRKIKPGEVVRRPIPGSKAEAILTLTTTTPARPQEIAESVNTTKQNVSQVLKRYGIEPNTTESYKIHRAEILAGLQAKILNTIDSDDIKAASLLQRITSVAVLADKERLERGQSTANIAIHADIAAIKGQVVDVTP